jgi:hypothetical protein
VHTDAGSNTASGLAIQRIHLEEHRRHRDLAERLRNRRRPLQLQLLGRPGGILLTSARRYP